ncbi:leucyl/phenylalanyl-tRNA--protein transferase [Saccharibacter sp. 17.LH.SD]|nr:leucyl/phenylalanyl-tRNA--protein transferase [Saccharibacter sp. 17.LH.SD]MXV43958.1 leucyl/phenylalanyl-tRNA--protein transferase [Saccharibacter sp. 17.LH.SD]
MDDITAEHLLRAYEIGIFPMAPSRESDELEWYAPQERGIIPLDAPHISKRLMRTVRAQKYRVSTDDDFSAMMMACAESMPGREESWISPRIRMLYGELHRQGYAHSVEVRRDSGELLGGLYGVSLGGAFFGESMVSRERDVSKIALVHLIAALRQGGYRLLDTQYVTPHLKHLGGIAVPLLDYQEKLHEALAVPAVWPQDVSFEALQRSILNLRSVPEGRA